MEAISSGAKKSQISGVNLNVYQLDYCDIDGKVSNINTIDWFYNVAGEHLFI